MYHRTFPALMAGLLIVSASGCHAQQPAPTDIYQQSLSQFQDATPADVKVTGTTDFDESREVFIDLAGYKRQRVSALLFEPKNASANHPAPCLLLLHGLGGRKELLAPVARIAASAGYASLLIDVAGATGAPAPAGGSSTLFPTYDSEATFAQSMVTDTVTTVVDIRHGLDMLETRPEIDSKSIGVVGYSLGALEATVAAAVDPRIKAVALMSGGGDIPGLLTYEAGASQSLGGQYAALIKSASPDLLRTQFAGIDPINYAAHISPRPLLMEHGKRDVTIPPEFAQKLYDAASAPKQINWFPEAGHALPPFGAFADLQVFLAKYLPVSQ